MEIHHEKHDGTYVSKVNAVLESYAELQTKGIEELIRQLNSLPEAVRTPVRNNGGGHFNHAIVWKLMAPNAGGKPTGAIAEAIDQIFGNKETPKGKRLLASKAVGIELKWSGWGGP